MTVYIVHAILHKISANIGSISVSSNSIGSNLIPNLPPAQNSKNQKKCLSIFRACRTTQMKNGFGSHEISWEKCTAHHETAICVNHSNGI